MSDPTGPDPTASDPTMSDPTGPDPTGPDPTPGSHPSVHEAFPAGSRALARLERSIHDSGLSSTTIELVKIRASQINGCAYCLDMHHKDARAQGETDERLYMLPAWREATCYTPAERAALALTEAITQISVAHVPAEVEAEARRHHDDRLYAALVFAIIAINSWNRAAIASHTPPGLYQPGQRRSSD